MNERDDLVERALGRLARHGELEAPDRALEAELRARHRKRPDGLRRFLLPGLVVASLSGAAYAGGWQLVRRWWFSIEVDGTVTEGAHEGDGARVFHLEPKSGGEATVTVSRNATDDGGERTRIELDRSAAGLEEHEVAEDVVGGAPYETLSAGCIAGVAPLFRFDAQEGASALYLLDEADPRLVLHRERATPETVLVLGTLPVEALSDEARLAFAVADDGELELVLTLSDGLERAFSWSIDPAARRAGEARLETDDGRIRVRVQNAPDSSEQR